MGGILIGFLQALLVCAIVILIAFLFVWAMRAVFNISIDGEVYRWGKIVVGLIVVIIMLSWLLSALGLLGGAGTGPHFLWRW